MGSYVEHNLGSSSNDHTLKTKEVKDLYSQVDGRCALHLDSLS